MSDFGTFAIDRGLFDHPVFAAEPFTEREAWAWMIGRASRAHGERRVGTVRIPLRRGQFAHSGRFLAKRWQWSLSRVQRFLARLVAESMIESVTESGVTRVTVCNYDKYQPGDAVSGSVNGSAVGQTKKESSITDSESVVGGESRARDSAISPQAFALADEVMKTLAISTEFIPPGWYGLPMWLHTGLASGWQADIIRIAAAKLRAKRGYEPPYSFKYLTGPIDRAHKEFATPALPMPPVGIHQQPEVNNRVSANQPTDWRGRRDQQHAAFAEFRAAARDATERECDERGGPVVRLVPNARRG